MKEYATTHGALRWNEIASAIDSVDDPVAPEGEGWRLVGNVLGDLRFSYQPIIWFWERDLPSFDKGTRPRPDPFD